LAKPMETPYRTFPGTQARLFEIHYSLASFAFWKDQYGLADDRGEYLLDSLRVRFLQSISILTYFTMVFCTDHVAVVFDSVIRKYFLGRKLAV